MVFLAALLPGLKAQTTLISPTGDGGFETGVDFASNGWSFDNGTLTNKWTLGTVPAGFSNRCAYISNNGGAAWNYTISPAAATSVVHFWRDVTFPVGESNITLTFNWQALGETSSFDALMVSIAPTSYTPTPSNTTLSTNGLAAPAVTFAQLWNVGAVQMATLKIPATLVGNCSAASTVRLIFTWKNDASAGNQPPAAIDNIALTSAPQSPLAGAGPFTIDNSAATGGVNFTNFTDAINWLNTSCVTVPVVFNVSAGQTFNENPPAITATGSASNTVTFQKYGAGANPVITPSGSAGTVDFGLCISGGDYITFDGIDINASAVSTVEYGYLLRNFSSTDGAQNNTVKNCSITLNRAVTASRGILQTATTTAGGFAPTAASGANSFNKYYNLSIQNVYAGVYLLGTATFPDLNCELGTSGNGTTIIGGAAANDIGNGTLQTWGIQAANQSGVKIFHAEVRNIGSTTTTDGILLILAQGVCEISNMTIHDLRGTSATSVAGVSGIRATHATTGTHSILIYNNFVYNLLSAYTGVASATRQLHGIYALGSGGSTAQVYNVDFNSIRLDGSGSPNISSACFEIGAVTGPLINARNNIFANVTGAQSGVAKHYCWVTTGASTVGNTGSVSNRNVLQVGNATNGFTGLTATTDRATLADWQGATGQDAASFSSDPRFESASNLHISTSLPTPVESGGSFFSGAITWAGTDIDGDARNATAPDIGADEGNFTFTDINPPAVAFSPLLPTCTTGDLVLTPVIITDQSGIPTSGPFAPRIYYRKGAGPWFSRPGTLDSGTAFTGTWSFSIVVADMGGILHGDIISYYIIAQDLVTPSPFTGSAPAGAVATDVNTVTTPPAAPNTLQVSFLNGTYTVGTGGDYPTLTAAVNAYNNSCVTGPVVFNLINNSYPAETFPIAINANPGASAVNTLTIKPVASGSTSLFGTSGTCILRLNGADYVTIDGSNSGGTSRNLVIYNASTATGTAAICVSSLGPNAGATHNTIRNCTIGCGADQSTSTNETFGILSHGTTINTTNDGPDNDGNAYQNNYILQVRWGIYLRGAVGNPNDNTQVSDNTIGDSDFGSGQIGRGGIILQHQNAAAVTQNEIRSVGVRYYQSATGADRVGIGLGDFNWPVSAATTITNSTVSGNRIHGVIEEKTFSSVGILVAGNGTPSANVIANNMIYDVRANGTASDQGLGIGIGAGDADKVVFNSVSLIGDIDPSSAANATQSVAGIRIGSTTPTNLTLKNNIIYANISSNTTTLKHFAIVAPAAYAWGSGGLNNNDYYAEPSNPQMALGGVGTTVPYTPINALADWKTTFTPNQDGNSKSVVPWFVAFSQDLHLLPEAINLPLNGSAVPIPGVTTDVDGQTRNATAPDMGADEFTPPAIDAALEAFATPQVPFGAGLNSVKVILKNLGGEPLQSATLGWEVNGTSQPAFNWSGALPSGDTVQVVLGTVSFNVGAIYNLKAWSSDPNGVPDPAPLNDTLLLTDTVRLDGIYTIGGTNPDFNTFTDAVNALHTSGIADSVIFNIRNGTYTEQISINAIDGADSLHPVIFQSEAGDSSLVILSFSANSTNNYTLKLNGADWLTFKRITIRATHPSYGIAVALTGNADNNTWTNNVLKGVSTTSTSDLLSTVYFYPTTEKQHNVFKKNLILNGSYGIYLNNISTPAQGTTVEENVFENQYYIALYMQEQSDPLVNKNTIFSNTTYNNYTGLYLRYCYQNTRITNNKIYGLGSGATGIFLNYVNGDLITPCIIANNFIQIGGSTNPATGISSTSSSYQNILYNTININNTNATSTALYCVFGDNRILQNNLLTNMGGGYAINIFNTGLLSVSDHNDFFTTGSIIGIWAGNNESTLGNWQSASSLDANSLSTNPDFLPPNSYNSSNIDLNNAGIPSVLVTTDIEGNPRDPIHPDIGAKEFGPLALDAGLFSVVSPKMPFTMGTNPVRVLLRNNGTDTLHSVMINWKINNVSQPAVNWSGSLPGGDTIGVLLGMSDFSIGISYNIQAICSIPNGIMDFQPSNDTIEQGNLSPSLAGTYTIGGLNPDFNTFTDAVNALHLAGVADSVIFNVRNGTYDEQITIHNYFGADSLRPVIFQSENRDSTLAILTHDGTGSSGEFTLRLDGANWLTFKNLTIQTTPPTIPIGNAILITGGSSHNQWLNNCLKSRYSQSQSRSVVIISSSQLCQYNIFKNNHFVEGGFGIRDISGPTYASGMCIEGNIFENQGNAAISIAFQNEPIVRNNLIQSDLSNGLFGVYFANISGGQITGNRIYMAYGGGAGIYLNNSVNDNTLVANNYIQIEGAYAANGIYSVGNRDVKILFNSVAIWNTNISSIAFYSNNDYATTVRNNIFMNAGGGYAISSTSGIISDYNDLFATGTSTGKWYYDDAATLQNWQNITGLDIHSRSVDPLFVNGTDFHVTNAALNQKGTPVPEVLTDIEGDLRDPSMPDIGADEFTPHPNDAGIIAITPPQAPFSAGTYTIGVTLKNNGSDTLKNVTINWAVNGAIQTPYNWTGALPSGETQPAISIGSFAFDEITKYVIQAWTSSPNGFPDPIILNDTASVDNLYAALAGTYTIGGTNPNFPTFQAAITALQNGGVTDAVFFNVRSGGYDVGVSINRVLGAGPDKRITFQSETGDSSTVMLFSGGNLGFIFSLNGADYFTFRKMTFTPGSNIYSTIELKNGANYNHFLNNHFTGVGDNNTIFIQSNNSTDSNNVIRSNQLENSLAGIWLSGSIVSPGTTIESNVFNNIRNPIFLQSQDAPVIKNNIIHSSSYNGTCVSCLNCINDYKITGNKIVANYANTGEGIYVSGSGAADKKALIANNFVQIGGTDLSHGILLYASNLNIYHNSVTVTSTHTESSAIYIPSFGSNLNVLDNVFSNKSGGYAVYFEGDSGGVNSDYNDFFASGPNLCHWNGMNLANLAALQASSGQETHSLSIDPFFVSNTDLHSAQGQLDSAALYLAEVPDDIDGEPRDASFPDIGADEFDLPAFNTGVASLIAPASACDLEANEPVTVRIQNFGSVPVSGFDVAYSINNGPPVVENVGAWQLQPGTSADYTFATTADLSAFATYIVTAYTNLPLDADAANDTLAPVSIENVKTPSIPVGMIPAAGAADLPRSIAFSWQPTPGANAYDLYIWPSAGTAPATPTVANLGQINIAFDGSSFFSYGATYNWQVIAKNNYCSTPGPVQSFGIIPLPDLVVNSVSVPAGAFSGQSLSVTWEVGNTGTGSTGMAQWTDAVYLSPDTILDIGLDAYLGGTANFSALGTGQSYSNTANVTLPQGLSGNYYVFLVTDKFGYVTEVNDSNNLHIGSNPIAITLTPPPDLQISAVVAPSNTFSGLPLSFNWTVTNKGTGQTRSGSWRDRVYFSSEPGLNTGTAIFLGERTFSGTLEVDSSYTQSMTAVLPQGINGTYYVYVVTDYFNDEYEHANDSNNSGQSNPVHVTLTPPPDLQVTNVAAPPGASNKENITIQWTVENLGGSTAAGVWTDKVYISSNPSLSNFTGLTPLDSFLRPNDLAPGGNYTQNTTVHVPDGITGNYYLYIVADANDLVFEYTFNFNNATRSTNATAVLSPDLTVLNVSATGTPASGDSLTVSWTLKNDGAGKLINGTWTDQLLLSTNATLDTTTALKTGALTGVVTLLPGSILNRQIKTALPNGISGSYYLFVYSDLPNTVYEHNSEGNNVNATGLPLNIALSPWIDLTPVLITTLPAANAGGSTPVTYQVKNAGTKAAAGRKWADAIYLSKLSTWNPDSSKLVYSSVISDTLAVDSIYSRTLDVSIPIEASTDTYYLFIQTDQDSTIYEYNQEGNNRLRSTGFQVTGYPPVDLAMVAASAPATAGSGQSITVSWTVENLAAVSTIAPFWSDAVYLSTDSIFNPVTDILLGSIQKTSPLPAQTSYSISLPVQLPNGVSGAYYLIVRTDNSGKVMDSNLANNNSTLAIAIQLTPSPDLIVTGLSAPAQVFAGQPIRIIWTAQNNGPGPTVPGSWKDVAYLSSDLVANPGDLPIGSALHANGLAPGASYTDTIDAIIPLNKSGNWVVVLKTDDNNTIYEHQAENNNDAASTLLILQPPPSDLVVSQVTVPASASAGQNVAVNWTLRNQGLNPAVGIMQEAVFFSKDSTWDVNDPLLVALSTSINLAPGGSQNRGTMADLTGVEAGNYYAIVRTDILNNIAETNDQNNTAASSQAMTVSIPELPLHVLTPAVLKDDKNLYYRIEVPDSMSGKTLLVSLKGDSVAGSNELYLRFGQAPTRAIHDFAFSIPFYGNQEVIVPALQAGTYYLLAYGNTAAGNQQAVTLYATILDFEIRKVTADEGGNTGLATVQVDGAKFEANMSVWLERPGYSIPALCGVSYLNSGRVFVQFDLRDQPLGSYDVVAKKPNGGMARLSSGFTIVPGGAAELVTNIVIPPDARPNDIITIRIEFQNEGNTDMVNPVVTLVSLDGAPVALSPSGIPQRLTSLDIPLNEYGAPPGLLRPGAAGAVTVYVKAVKALNFLIALPE